MKLVAFDEAQIIKGLKSIDMIFFWEYGVYDSNLKMSLNDINVDP